MATLTLAQLESLALQQGLTPAEAAIAASVAKAESGGRTDAQGDIGLQDAKWGPSVGLWQVRSVKAQKGTGQTRDASALTDPVKNAQSMAQISSQGNSWGAWTTFTNGAYKKFLPDAQAALGGVRADTNFDSLTQSGGGASTVNPVSVNTETVFLGEDRLKGWLKDYVPGAAQAGELAGLVEYTIGHAAEFTVRGIEFVMGMQLLWIGSASMLLVLGLKAADNAPEPVKKGAKLASYAFPELDVAKGAQSIGKARTAARAAKRAR